MTIAAYQTLYESSVAFGMRKALQAEQGKVDMAKKVCSRAGCRHPRPGLAFTSIPSSILLSIRGQIVELEAEKRELETQSATLKAKCGTLGCCPCCVDLSLHTDS